MNSSDGGFQCQHCGVWRYPGQPHYCWIVTAPSPIGCICPPGANLQCERYDCPRKGVSINTAGTIKTGIVG